MDFEAFASAAAEMLSPRRRGCAISRPDLSRPNRRRAGVANARMIASARSGECSPRSNLLSLQAWRLDDAREAVVEVSAIWWSHLDVLQVDSVG